MNRTQLYLPKTQLDSLRKVARQQNTTVSGVLRYIISIQLSHDRIKHQKLATIHSLEKFSNDVNRIGTKAPKDLSKKIDAYVY